MFFHLLLLFTVIPLLELSLLLRIGREIGVFYTLAIVLFTGVLGAVLAKSQGYMIVRKIREDISMQIIPADRMLEGVLILIGGVTLLTPGFVTDTIGFLLLIPYTRKVLIEHFKKKLKNKFEGSQSDTYIDV